VGNQNRPKRKMRCDPYQVHVRVQCNQRQVCGDEEEKSARVTGLMFKVFFGPIFPV
jgi:hypothetical protein